MALVPRRFPRYAAGLDIAGTRAGGEHHGRAAIECGAKAWGNCQCRVKSVSLLSNQRCFASGRWDFGFRLRDGVSQLAPQDFAGSSLRNGIHEMDCAWLFVWCEAVGDEGAELFP